MAMMVTPLNIDNERGERKENHLLKSPSSRHVGSILMGSK